MLTLRHIAAARVGNKHKRDIAKQGAHTESFKRHLIMHATIIHNKRDFSRADFFCQINQLWMDFWKESRKNDILWITLNTI